MRGNAVKSMLAVGLVSGLALGAIAAVPLTRSESVEFGPPIHDDASLNANLGVLARVVAWKNAPGSDAFQVADAVVSDDDFNAVGLVQLAATPDEPGD